MNLQKTLDERVSLALDKAGAAGADSIIKTAARPEFGDYQANGCMAAAKKRKTNPRQFAEKVVENLEISDIAEKVEIAGPGFINIHLKNDWLAAQVNQQSLHVDAGAAGHFGVVLKGVGSAEKRDDGVPFEFVDGTLIAQDDIGHLR